MPIVKHGIQIKEELDSKLKFILFLFYPGHSSISRCISCPANCPFILLPVPTGGLWDLPLAWPIPINALTPPLVKSVSWYCQRSLVLVVD